MGKDFMVNSPSYMAFYSKKGEAGKTLLRMRDIILQHTQKDFFLGRGMVDVLVDKLGEELHLAVSKTKIRDELQLYRKIHLYFNGTEEEKEKVRGEVEAKNSRTILLRFLLKDKINPYEKTQEPPVDTCCVKENQENDLSEKNDDLFLSHTVTFFDEIQKMLSEGKSSVTNLVRENKSLRSVIDQKTTIVKNLRDELHVYLSDRDRDNELLRDRIKELENEVRDQKLLEKEYEKEIETLEERLRTMQSRLEADISKVVRRMLVDETATSNFSSSSKEEIIKSFDESDLPQFFRALSGFSAKYSPRFIKTFVSLEPDSQSIVLKALNQLSEYGSKYPALKSCKLISGTNYSPKNCQKSRAGINYRFCWSTHSTENVVEFFELVSRENFNSVGG